MRGPRDGKPEGVVPSVARLSLATVTVIIGQLTTVAKRQLTSDSLREESRSMSCVRSQGRRGPISRRLPCRALPQMGLLVSAVAVLRSPLRLCHPLAAGLVAAALAGALTGPPALAWFLPVLWLKLIGGHAVRMLVVSRQAA
jgi:hypothetical protein